MMRVLVKSLLLVIQAGRNKRIKKIKDKAKKQKMIKAKLLVRKTQDLLVKKLTTKVEKKVQPRLIPMMNFMTQ